MSCIEHRLTILELLPASEETLHYLNVCRGVT